MRWAFLVLLMPSQLFAIENGTLLFVENGQNLVECYTKSSYSHVAIVLDDCVYEAELPEVKKYTVQEWFTNIGKYNDGKGSPALVEIQAPDKPYTKEELGKMKVFLESQVGRRYSIRGYLRKIPGTGIHCSEMCATALESSGRCNFSVQNCEISPGDLHDWISGHHQVGNQLYVRIKPEHRRTLCSRWSDWWKHKGTACGWSCCESLTFCW